MTESASGTRARSGGCLCEQIRFVVTGEPDDPHICVCRHCSHRSGSPFQWWVSFPTDGLRWTGSGGEPTWYDTHPGRTRRGFCPNCGSHIAAANHGDDAVVGILVTAVDNHQDDALLVPTNLNRLAEAAPWLTGDSTIHRAVPDDAGF